MPFFLFLVFGVWFLLICLGSSGKQAARRKNFPSCRYQEEYLLFYKKFIEYRTDPSRTDPIGDALEDARYELWQQGHLPSSLVAYGMADWYQRPIARRQPLKPYTPKMMPLYFELEYYRALDRSYGNHSMQADFLEYHGKDIVFNEEKWRDYCLKIDQQFEEIWLQQQPQYAYTQLQWVDRHDVATIVESNDGYVIYDPQRGHRTAVFANRVIGRIHDTTWTEWAWPHVLRRMNSSCIGDLVYIHNRYSRVEQHEFGKRLGMREDEKAFRVVPIELEKKLQVK